MSNATTTIRRRSLPPPASRRRALRVVASPDAAALERSFELDGTTWTFGREVSGPGGFADLLMSREHARVAVAAGRYVVEDLGGSNGTYLDGRRVTTAELADNSVLSIGDTLFVVDRDPDPDLLPAAPGVSGEVVSEYVGISFFAERVRRAIETIAPANGAVLLLGPTGSGKEVAAKAIHRLGGRSGAWVPVNCAAIPHDIAEAELFGYKRGAFTGAVADRDGFFVAASGGTLFLDEVGDLPLPLQAKLLRVLEDGSIQALGGGLPRQVDLRVVAATHLDLDGTDFRRDLLARLGDWVLHLPRLADRRADILALWDHFVRMESAGARPATAELAEALLLHDWPMNVRELQKLARRLCTLGRGSAAFDVPLLPESMQRPLRSRPQREGAPDTAVHQAVIVAVSKLAPESVPERTPVPEAGAPDRAALEAALRRAKGNVSLVADQNNWHRTQLYRWIKRAGLDPDHYRDA